MWNIDVIWCESKNCTQFSRYLVLKEHGELQAMVQELNSWTLQNILFFLSFFFNFKDTDESYYVIFILYEIIRMLLFALNNFKNSLKRNTKSCKILKDCMKWWCLFRSLWFKEIKQFLESISGRFVILRSILKYFQRT